MAEGERTPKRSDIGKTVLPPLFYFLTETNRNQIIVTISKNIAVINAMI